MNAVEIEQAISELALQPFDGAEFPFTFLAAFGNKEATLKRLRKGDSNASDVSGGILQRNNIHIATCQPGAVSDTLKALRDSPATAKAKAKFILATDGQAIEAEEQGSNDVLACPFTDLPNHFGFFLPLAGISTIREIKENPIDVRATGRLNKLYVELLKENPDWATEKRRPDMNHFMARLIFCFFAEDTDIFNGDGIFTQTVEQMSERDGSNTHTVLSEIFRAMNVNISERSTVQPRLPSWADQFPYVNGGLFSGSTEVPRFTRTARSYLRQTGDLNWKQINPDIFGSMIQAVADDEERGSLGMHYTSVPNILKVLNPLFLDELRSQLEAAGDNKAKLLNLRKRMARIRVFDPACGSGNFLVIAYKQMRAIEAEINKRRGEPHLGSEIPLTNFRGIELRDFPAEIARLALIIAEFQCDVLYRGQKDALAEFLPLSAQNWIVCGNALRLDWLGICPPTGTAVKVLADDLFEKPLDQAEMDFKNEGGETFICGNPPYQGVKYQSQSQKADLENVFAGHANNWKSLDYVAAWFMKAALYGKSVYCDVAFVATNSICQGQQVAVLWEAIYATGYRIHFAHSSFKWMNLASHNAGVTVVIVGISNQQKKVKKLYSPNNGQQTLTREVAHINAYLGSGADVFVQKRASPLGGLPEMEYGSMPNDGGNLLLTPDQLRSLDLSTEQRKTLVRPICGADELISGNLRFCLWIEDQCLAEAKSIAKVLSRINATQEIRLKSARPATVKLANQPHRFGEVRSIGKHHTIVVPITFSEGREYLTASVVTGGTIVSVTAFALHDAPLWNLAVLSSRIFLGWVGTIGGKLETRYRFTNTVVWNTFPIPHLTEQSKTELTACAEAILLAREAHFPATIADLYDTEGMPENLRMAHERNDEVLERIYIGRRFKNDTERLEKLFDMYTKMTAAAGSRRIGKKV